MSLVKVGVLRGGPSGEYEVSLKTGSSVLHNLPAHYEPVDILIDRDGIWHLKGEPVSPYTLNGKVDVIFNALHGKFGEDGEVQAILDTIKIPYTGSGRFASAIGMNKAHSKDFFQKNNLRTARHILIGKDDDNIGELAYQAFTKISPPWIVKPADGGSSLGTSLVLHYEDLPRAIESAFAFSDQVIIEEFIKGREATCGVVEGLRGQKIYSLLPVEIKKPTDKKFFDYDAKYQGTSEEICPGNFSDEEKKELEETAIAIHQMLGLRHYSRSDFIISPKGIYVLEVNTLPGLTQESLLPKSLSASGISYSEFLDHVLKLALGKE
jgi:D-alanine-D-alanine ligase